MNVRTKQILLGFLITCILASPALVAGADWNMFHENPQRTGYLEQPADFTPLSGISALKAQ